jgi:hypothetical protein
MKNAAYRPLSRPEMELLLAPQNSDAALAWSRLRGALHGVVGMVSITYPRPLYYYEDAARADLVEQPRRLAGTPFHRAAIHNVHAAAEIERLFRERGHTPEVHALADEYLDALLEEFEAIRLYPEVPPRPVDEENGLAEHRAVAGR